MIIRNIWGVGRNFAKHAAEMKAELPKEPLIFLKAGSSASVNSTEIELPSWVEEVHHEVELALKLSNHLHVVEAAVALDLTERKRQAEAKKNGTPWTMAKSFDGACPVSAFFMVRKLEDLEKLTLRLTVNDVLKQEAPLSEMIFKPTHLLEYIKEHFPVCAGDLILTGTPEGVGPIQAGDVVRAEISGEISHTWKVIQAKKREVSNPS
ncbi:MAG: fumarylacetoacetate hydrolase family protein [Proteobacteria bacterium]|jgi:2-keto-4-pentenoate hydratase/2-oxohepta-3-ene-1,7-dioic acid hydratase in catechol pathway|nr:fumarylacetoacetate hydrolase family protein [Pseudomonadota bacterium]